MAGGDPMLNTAVETYLSIRRIAGFALEGPDYILRSFARFASARGEEYVRTQTVIEWASEAHSLGQRDRRLNIVRRFADHVQAEDARHEVPPKNFFCYRKKRRIPFIFSAENVNSLLKASAQLGPPDSLRPHTYTTLFALLITTGLRISEALALVFNDVTPDGLVIRKTKFKKSRIVPLHETAQDGLERYFFHRKRVDVCDDHIFISLRGKVLDRSAVQWTFRRILRTIGLDPAADGRRPHIHDFRHSYACNALLACPKGRENISRHIRALSTYMGHVHVSDTYWYLSSIPQLMNIAGQRFENACGQFPGVAK